MSADLFAEFAGLSTNSPQPTSAPQSQAQSQSPSQPLPKPTTTQPVDPFAFLFTPSSRAASPQTFQLPAQSWTSTPSPQLQIGANGWGHTRTPPSATVVAQPKEAVLTNEKDTDEKEDDEGGWGDFMEAPSTTYTEPLPSVPSDSFANASAQTKTSSMPMVRNRIHRADTFDLMSNNLVDVAGAKPPEPWQHRPSWGIHSEAKTQAFHTSVQQTKSKPPPPTVSIQKPKSKPKPINSDILFDADEFDGVPPEDDDDDDFGDFESGQAQANTVSTASAQLVQPALVDLMSIDFGAPSPPPSALGSLATTPTFPKNRKAPPEPLGASLGLSTTSLTPSPFYPQAPKSPSFSDRNPFPGLAVTTPVSGSFPPELKGDDKEKSPTPVTAWPGAQSAGDKDDWDAFADFPTDASSATPAGLSVTSSSWDWDAVDVPKSVPPRRTSKIRQEKTPGEEVIGPPPTNIPPPSILLSVFAEIFEEADTKLYKPTSNQPAAVKSRIYADPGTIDYLQGYLVLATVAARILAGRKQRWHRDRFLSQGMSISAAGSKGGMKLAGIDKAQTAREDREAADVVGVWRDHVGKLKSAVAAANIGIQKQIVKIQPLRVPEINDHMAVSTAKVVPTAPKACCVCGLKRDERVKGVDHEVEDSFGEWWIEHWGHRACRNFWLGNEEKLRSR